jgi:putative flippase GtrA
LADSQSSILHLRGLSLFYEKYKSLPRFAVVGCINTVVDFAVFFLLQRLGVNYLICQVAGYSLGLINSFVMNKLWSFESKISQISTSLQFVKFIAVNLISLGISLVALKVLNGYHGVNIFSSKVMVTIFLTQFINYFGYKLWVFRK